MDISAKLQSVGELGNGYPDSDALRVIPDRDLVI